MLRRSTECVLGGRALVELGLDLDVNSLLEVLELGVCLASELVELSVNEVLHFLLTERERSLFFHEVESVLEIFYCGLCALVLILAVNALLVQF